MRLASSIRKLHKWVFLFVGIQALLWTLSGFYMVAMDLDFIRGNPLVHNVQEPLPEFSTELFPTALLLRGREGVKSVKLRATGGVPYYIVHDHEGIHRHNAYTGAKQAPLDRSNAIALAEFYFAGDAPALSAELITEDPPSEIPARILPIWRINFDDAFATSLYIDPTTAALVTRRHNYWRAFDFFWMLHIMDYEERADVNNALLQSVAIVNLVGALSGTILLFFSFRWRSRRARRTHSESREVAV